MGPFGRELARHAWLGSARALGCGLTGFRPGTCESSGAFLRWATQGSCRRFQVGEAGRSSPWAPGSEGLRGQKRLGG
eukprot:15449541-Alexandrium_andersonii.AAC.1